MKNELSYFLEGKNKSQTETAEKVSALKKKLSLWKKRVRNQNFAMFLVSDSKIGDQETNKWLTALINDHISHLRKKMKDHFPTFEPSSAWILQPFIAETKFSSSKDQVQLLLPDKILVQYVARIS